MDLATGNVECSCRAALADGVMDGWWPGIETGRFVACPPQKAKQSQPESQSWEKPPLARSWGR